jgi:cytochrome d ubiquinol oxidase subunit II
MTQADAAVVLLWLSLTAYAVLAGADFGGGVWDIFATGPRKRAQRQAVARAMGPVWEANHVWLIFMITGLFTAFPIAFGSLGLALYIPVTIALLGIVLRGAAFVFRAHGRAAVGELSPWGLVFGGSSIITPFFLGTAAAAVASGSIRISGGRLLSGFGAGWSTPFAVVVGLLSVALCAYLAAAYLMVETEDDPALQSDFRRRALVASAVSGALALLGLWVAYAEAPRVWTDLTGNGLVLMLLALINGPIALWGVWRWRPRITRVAVAAQVALVLWAWALGQWPYLVPPDVTIAAAAAPAATLQAWLVVVTIGMAMVIPSLVLLFRVFKARNPASGEPARMSG